MSRRCSTLSVADSTGPTSPRHEVQRLVFKSPQVRVLTLADNQHLDSTLFRVEKGWTVEFRLGPSLLGKQVTLYVNHPDRAEDRFHREQYRPLPWQLESGRAVGNVFTDDVAVYAQLVLTTAGSFRFFFIHGDGTEASPNGSGYLNVAPSLPLGENGTTLPLDCIQCQTVLAKSLGPFDEWEARLRVAKESGYNMIHFTPIQELGGSNSSYSLKDQLKLNPVFNGKSVPSFDDVRQLTEKMRTEWKVLSLCDIVLNHTANESPWLQEHPECTYNMRTAPHLIPAAILDAALHLVTVDSAAGRLLPHGIPNEVFSPEHINALKFYLENELVPSLRLDELYQCDVAAIVSRFSELARQTSLAGPDQRQGEIKLIYTTYQRRGAEIDYNSALNLFNINRSDSNDEDDRIQKCASDLERRLHELNSKAAEEVRNHLVAAISNSLAGVKYFRLQDDGPKLREVSEANPLVPRYFTGQFKDLKSAEEDIFSERGQYVMAHNGWVMNSDPLSNFALAGSNVYIRRELIAWGDSVKLRFGEKKEDCPFLWDLMRKYVEQTALIFDGIRLDNCHSTPLNVAEYLLDCARAVRPELYVAAELFTNSDQTDNVFVNRLGITSLIREAMSAWDSHELGRLVYRYGGEPAGGFSSGPHRPLMSSIAHALFLDVTHDNPSPVDKRSVFDLLPSAALVAMACCASGSSRGYDELVPHHIHVVEETRLYSSWTDGIAKDAGYVNANSGIITAKRALNDLHSQLGRHGFSQVFVDQMSEDIVAVTRHNPISHETVILVSFTSFHQPSSYVPAHPDVRNLRVEGRLAEILLEARVLHKDPNTPFASPTDFKKDPKYINGLSQYQVIFQKNIPIHESQILNQVNSGSDKVVQFEFRTFQPGSVVVIRVVPYEVVSPHLERLSRQSVKLLSGKADDDLAAAISQLTLADLNHALYRCEQEENEMGTGGYNVPNFGSFVYCGLQGFMSALSEIRPNNDLGHPVCNNLRQGDWMMDYVSGRLKKVKGTHALGVWIEDIFESVKQIPRYLVPRYFDAIVTGVYSLLISRTVYLMSDFVRDGSNLVKGLALGSVQFTGVIPSAPLPPPSPALSAGAAHESSVTMSAGLPHFTTGYMRAWGRDTFIALRGLFLLTGRYQEARHHILGFAACLRHGLIPNLLDRGVNARYNCRDAVWWWLYSITEYINLTPGGQDILDDPVSRIYPTDDSPALSPGLADMPLKDVIHEALSVHFQGLSLRERNAGTQIDAHMVDQGFNNNIAVDLNTGFVYGGNENNCGTWMDKMGSSDKAGNKGKPATPRDGAAVEIVSLCKAVLRELHQLYTQGVYPHGSVQRFDRDGNVTSWTLKEWGDKIAANFEKHFWIGELGESDVERPDLVNRRSIYKDVVGASQQWTDYQLRCNFPIALVVAPEILNPERAWRALEKARELILGPLGMRTLDAGDWAYRGDYHNDNDSLDINVAHGWNYHQGPEWVWPVGFFLRARLHFAKAVGGATLLQKTVFETRSYLSRHYEEILNSPWRGLPELTNKDGAYCSDSCRTQAWSMSCVLEVMHDMHVLERQLLTETTPESAESF